MKDHYDKLSKGLTKDEKETYVALKKKDEESNFNPEDLDKAQKAHDAVKQQIKTNNDIVQIHRRIQQNQGLERVYNDTKDSALEQQELLDEHKKQLERQINKYIDKASLTETEVSHLSAALKTYESLGGKVELIKQAKSKMISPQIGGSKNNPGSETEVDSDEVAESDTDVDSDEDTESGSDSDEDADPDSCHLYTSDAADE